MAEQQRRGAYVGLAAASALVVLIASGVAVTRLASGDHPGRGRSDTASPTGAAAGPGATSGTAAGDATAAPGAAAGGAGGAPSAQPVPVPPAGPASSAVRARTERTAAAAGGGSARAGASSSSPSARGSDAAGTPGPSSPSHPSSGSDGSTAGGGSPPATQGSPGTAPLLAVSVSAGQGVTGGVVGVGLDDSLDADVTLGTTQVVGDAPPSHGTAIGLGSRYLRPPPTIPLPPG